MAEVLIEIDRGAIQKRFDENSAGNKVIKKMDNGGKKTSGAISNLATRLKHAVVAKAQVKAATAAEAKGDTETAAALKQKAAANVRAIKDAAAANAADNNENTNANANTEQKKSYIKYIAIAAGVLGLFLLMNNKKN